MHLQLEYILCLSLFFFIIHQKDWKIVIFDVITFYFKMFLTYVNKNEYVYFASSYYIYIFIHGKMIHQQPLSFHYYWL